jgi:hypothetical protein
MTFYLKKLELCKDDIEKRLDLLSNHNVDIIFKLGQSGTKILRFVKQQGFLFNFFRLFEEKR